MVATLPSVGHGVCVLPEHGKSMLPHVVFKIGYVVILSYSIKVQVPCRQPSLLMGDFTPSS
jgi:hypothetical protein